LRQHERARQVRRQDGVPVVALHAQHQLVLGDPGVVHQDIDPSVPLQGPRHQRFDRRGVTHVGRRDLGLAATRRDRRHRGRRVVAARGGDDRRTLSGQLRRNRAADAARRARHERDTS
jgi:hypothetical protein